MIKRILKEISNLEKEQLSHIYTYHHEKNLRHLDILFIGPRKSPYSRMFLRFTIDFPEDYPLKPPKIVFTSSYGFKIHPNVYPGGWICLDTLNTGGAKGWVPSISLTSLLKMLYSMFTREMIMGEDNTETNQRGEEFFPAVMYDTFCITTRLLQDEQNPKFKKIMQNYVKNHREWYLRKLDRLSNDYDGKILKNYYTEMERSATFVSLKKSFEHL